MSAWYLDGAPPRLMLLVFVVIIALAGWLSCGIRPVSCPPKTRAMPSLSPSSPTGASQPRVQAVTSKINAILKKAKASGLGDHRRLFRAGCGQRLQHRTIFIVYEDWSKRRAALSQDKILAHLRWGVAAIQEAMQ